MGVLRVNVAGVWTDVMVPKIDEFFVGPVAPTAPDTELWYDTAAVPAVDPAKMPRGYIGQAGNSSSQAVVTVNTWHDITGCSVTWTADPARYYKTTVKGSFLKTTASGYVYVRIADGAGGNKEQIGEHAVLNQFGGLSFAYVESGLSGTQTRKLQGLNETNGVQWSGVAQDRCLILVEDIGGV